MARECDSREVQLAGEAATGPVLRRWNSSSTNFRSSIRTETAKARASAVAAHKFREMAAIDGLREPPVRKFHGRRLVSVINGRNDIAAARRSSKRYV
jgi:hypothetical protein